VGATTLSFLGEGSSFASLEHDATSKKMNIVYSLGGCTELNLYESM
jgi:hypothetical protein